MLAPPRYALKSDSTSPRSAECGSDERTRPRVRRVSAGQAVRTLQLLHRSGYPVHAEAVEGAGFRAGVDLEDVEHLSRYSCQVLSGHRFRVGARRRLNTRVAALGVDGLIPRRGPGCSIASLVGRERRRLRMQTELGLTGVDALREGEVDGPGTRPR